MKPGFGKIFFAHELRRISVICTPEATEAIAKSSHGGRMFPQALSEMFGELPEVEKVHVAIAPKHTLVPVSEQNRDDLVLLIDIVNGRNSHRFLVNYSDLCHYHSSGWHSFNPAETARELVRLYKER